MNRKMAEKQSVPLEWIKEYNQLVELNKSFI